MDKSNDFLKKLLQTFKSEAEEHIEAMSTNLVILEKETNSVRCREIIEVVFREAHNLKGAARSVNHKNIEAICQSLESIFAAIKSGEIALSAELFDMIHAAIDFLSRLIILQATESNGREKENVMEIIVQLEQEKRRAVCRLDKEKVKESKPDSEMITGQPASIVSGKEVPVTGGTVRISTAKLEELLFQIEELLTSKLASEQLLDDLQDYSIEFTSMRQSWKKVHNGIGLTGLERTTVAKNSIISDEFIDWNYEVIKALENKLAKIMKTAQRNQRSFSRAVDNLLDDTKKILMLPFSSISGIFPKYVRDIARQKEKDVNLLIQGMEVEIDRRILEMMKDPLIHIVRNCIDHGIEKPQERARKNKPLRGTISIIVTPRDSGKVEITITDDGAGIDIKCVRETALKHGIISKQEAQQMDEQKVASLIFISGITTSPIITTVSGRGIGLAIVKEKVEKLGGSLFLESITGKGVTLKIRLPLTIATFRGITVRVNEDLFVVPTMHVEQVFRIKKDDIRTVENRESIQYKERAVSLVRLRDILELPVRSDDKTVSEEQKEHIIILNLAEERIAYLVDEILDEQEVMVKSLGRQLTRVRNIAGAAALGTGMVVPVINVADVMKSAYGYVPGVIVPLVEDRLSKKKKKCILVVEDSITARVLLKNTLESFGYKVKTAVDGIDAWTELQTETIDLLVSDVDMPRMNGFELVAKIRSDKKLSDLPVILVTALESRDDKERGIEVGANAYIIKSSFDQSNLLEIITRLI